VGLLDFFSIATKPDGWTTFERDVQAKVVDVCGKRCLIFQGTDVDFDVRTGRFHGSVSDLLADIQLWPGPGGFPAGVEALDQIVARIVQETNPMMTMGWSLGGMLAMSAARFGIPLVYTFGAPAIWPLLRKTGFFDAYHVVLRSDGLIPWYPAFLYRRPGAEILLGEGKRSVFNHSIMKYQAALQLVDL
jgi:alpha-beta hydrolase superfamily lysophospholipase